jgi:hypothetical protein
VLLVIFGAGASYDSVSSLDDYGLRRGQMPPLANDLFAASRYSTGVLARYPEATPVVAHMRTVAGRGRRLDVERELLLLSNEVSKYADRDRHLMGVRFYLRDRVAEAADRVRSATSGVTNYAALIDLVRRWSMRSLERVGCVTFNYDTLLEDALAASFGRGFDTVSHYMTLDWPLYKPHGSTTWVQRFEWIISVRRPPAGFVDVEEHISSPLGEPVVASEVGAAAADHNRNWAPALAVPLAEKSEFACPPDHLRDLQGRLPTVTRLLIVGWRAREAHFRAWLEGMHQCARVLVVSESDAAAGETILNLPHNLARRSERHGGGFHTLAQAAVLHEFLEAPIS